jgi:hypothetical protein
MVHRKKQRLAQRSRSWRLDEHFVHQAVFLGFHGGEITVAFGFTGDLFDTATGMFGQNLVDPLSVADDFLGLNFDIGNLSADLSPGADGS